MISKVYDKCWEIYQWLENTNDSCNSTQYQSQVKEGQAKAELGIVMVNQLQIFSTNEDFEEITTNEIRFMTLSALCGYFCYKDMETDRLTSLERCKDHLLNFLRLCKNYGITTVSIADEATDETPSARFAAGSQEEIIDMAKQRQAKIDRFRKQKEDENKLKDLYEKVKDEHVDEEIKREYYCTLLQTFISRSLEDLDAIQREMPLMKRMSELGGPGHAPPREPRSTESKRHTPFILTKDHMQKHVFGMGYTNLPTYSIEEFLDQQVAKGNLPEPGTALAPVYPTPEEILEGKEKETIDKEKLAEVDDSEHLQRQRDWDDWKDDQRRGWGNRQNMG